MVDRTLLENMDLPDLSDAIDVYTRHARFCQPTPENSHLSLLYKIRELHDKECNYLEIGTLFGFSMVNASRSSTKGKFVGIDLFETTGKIYVNDYTPDIRHRNLSIGKTTRLVETCNIHNHDIELILGNSTLDTTYDRAVNICSNYHLMFIDGDHSYEGTLRDFLKYTPLLESGGYLLLDDQDYPDIEAVIKTIRTDFKDEYEWVPWPEYAPKFNGFFIKK